MARPPASIQRSSPERAARDAKRRLARMRRPSRSFDAGRYFRAAADLGFYNIGSGAVRAMARTIVSEHPDWTLAEAMRFADALMADRVLEVKGLAIVGAAAARWAEKIRNPPSRLDKIGLKPGAAVSVIGSLEQEFLDELAGNGRTVSVGRARKASDVITALKFVIPVKDR